MWHTSSTQARQTSMTQRPDVFQYDVHGAFIGDMIDWLRETTTYMSYRWAAKRLEVAPGNLVNIVKGTRRLPEERIPLVADIFKLSVDEAEYFGLLVAHDHAATEESRRATRDAMTGHRRIRQAIPLERPVDPFAHWWYGAVRELLSMPQASSDPEWVASVILPPITPDQAREAITALHAAGLLPGQLSDTSIGTGHVKPLGVGAGYMDESMQIAQTANERFPASERFVVAFTATLSEEGWRAFVKRLERMMEVLFDHCETDPHPPDRVLQFNLQAFPVAKVPTRKR